jgi:hypothetical protein
MNWYESTDSRALELLRRVLPETQWTQFSRTGLLEVAGCRGTYRISAQGLTRVFDPETGRPRASACLQLSIPAPAHDRIVAEYVLIRNDEDLYWQTANIVSVDLENLRLIQALMVVLDTVLFVILGLQLAG